MINGNTMSKIAVLHPPLPWGETDFTFKQNGSRKKWKDLESYCGSWVPYFKSLFVLTIGEMFNLPPLYPSLQPPK